VSKERILQAIREAASDQEGQKIAGLKKQAMAKAATAAPVGKGWLPSLLRPLPAAA
jgi:ParB family chromosome partitioning protein